MIIARRMTRNPVTATPDMSVGEASDLMRREKVHRLPVLDKNKNLVGVITEKDVLYASPSPASSLSIHEMAYLLSKLKVKDLMTKDVVTITEDTTVEEAARLMVDQDLSCLPVVNARTLRRKALRGEDVIPCRGQARHDSEDKPGSGGQGP